MTPPLPAPVWPYVSFGRHPRTLGIPASLSSGSSTTRWTALCCFPKTKVHHDWKVGPRARQRWRFVWSSLRLSSRTMVIGWRPSKTTLRSFPKPFKISWAS
ncbi:hypothetical protein PAXRUDRAFT_351483 [Paxillus rubicundulus Ve08.2h10]|uniref:Uncharacterized protein n=1 Tax=Paxillus rubicundulus Ve08.2h10 TaxID=930991 RepID=A0A0D0E9K6_9AGAM|nr:hypothetical protein PAXRUDRAFT_351483 [Paxillus rubicundulus Ve08.2h10]